MNRVLFAVIFSFLLAFPSVAFCQFPWGALNNTIQQFNNGIALGQQQEAINNQREYLRQQAQALNQQNELARQQIELQRQMLNSNKTDPRKRAVFTDEELSQFSTFAEQCPKDFIRKVALFVVDNAKRSEKGQVVTYTWGDEWSRMDDPHAKFLRLGLLAIFDKCNGRQVKRINIVNRGEVVAYLDPSIDEICVNR